MRPAGQLLTFDPASGTYQCRSCAGVARAVRWAKDWRQRARAGDTALTLEARAAVLAAGPAESPAAVAEIFRAIGRMNAAKGRLRTGGSSGAGTRTRTRSVRGAQWSRGKWVAAAQSRVAGNPDALEARQCWRCGLFIRVRRDTDHELHGQCAIALRGDATLRGQWRRRKQVAELAVRQAVLLGEDSTAARASAIAALEARQAPPAARMDRTEAGRALDWLILFELGNVRQEDIAASAHVSQGEVSKGIAAARGLLPPEGLASADFRPLVAALRLAAANPQFARQARPRRREQQADPQPATPGQAIPR